MRSKLHVIILISACVLNNNVQRQAILLTASLHQLIQIVL